MYFTMADISNYTQFIEASLQQASRLALEYFGKVTSSVKDGDNNQVLTEADLAVGQFLVAQVKRTFPDYNIIDEEAGVTDNGSRYTWVIDPIDGTSNFANGSPLYGIMLGLLDGGMAVAGGAVLPAFGEIYVATKGNGAFCNGKKIAVSTETELRNALVAYGIDGHQEAPETTIQEVEVLGDIILGIRNLRDSNSVFDTALVAKGVYGAALNRTSKIWDNVAVQSLIEEAGGVYTDFFGQPIDYSDPLSKADQNFTLCAGAPAIHRQLQKIINAH